MVKRVSLFQTADGCHFETEALAKEHEATIAAKSTIAALLKKLKLDGSFIGIGEEDTLALDTFLLDNRAALLEALIGVKPERKARAPRKPKLEAHPATVEEKADTVTAPTNDAVLDELVTQLGA